MTVALDTMILIWGLQKVGNPNQADLKELQCLAHILIDLLQESKETVLIPCITVAELLTGVDSSKHSNFIATLQTNFFCPPFDIRASEMAAKLFMSHHSLPAEDRIGRKTLKSDVMIVATSSGAGAATFFTHDAKCRKLAKLAGMEGKDLPTSHPDTYRDAEIKKEHGVT